MLRLVCGNLNYSSWSVRPWVALTHAGAEFKTHDVGLRTAEGWKDRILGFSGAGKVPVLVDGSLSVHESLAICEYIAELYPAAKLWPEDRKLRARGRAISCEMLSSFSALRQHLPMNLRARRASTPSAPGVAQDIDRILSIWDASLGSSGGPFLLGDFSIADCMYFPVVTRFRTYAVPLGAATAAYSERIFASPFYAELERLALAAPPIPEYETPP